MRNQREVFPRASQADRVEPGPRRPGSSVGLLMIMTFCLGVFEGRDASDAEAGLATLVLVVIATYVFAQAVRFHFRQHPVEKGHA